MDPGEDGKRGTEVAKDSQSDKLRRYNDTSLLRDRSKIVLCQIRIPVLVVSFAFWRAPYFSIFENARARF